MQISNSKLCESSKCWVYSTVNHPWLFHRRGLLWLGTAARYTLTYGCNLDLYYKSITYYKHLSIPKNKSYLCGSFQMKSKTKVSVQSFHIIVKALQKVTTDCICNGTVHDDAAQQLYHTIRITCKTDSFNVLNMST